jgi:hypothetical protein
MLLPDQTVLNVEVWKANKAEKYIPSEDRWVSAGTLPVNLIQGSEIGAALLLPDGRAFYIGASGKTALYSPPADYHDAGTWAAGADLPDNHGAWDAPAAMLPNGKVLLAIGPHSYNGPTDFYEYDPTANAYTKVAGSPAFSGAPWETRMLMLPTGQVLWANGSTGLYVYTPDGGPDPSWQPVISDIQDNGDGSFVLTGTQLNGISEGAAYGDDAEMSSNYPIVQLTDANGSVSYARTFNWSSTGVATGDTPVSTQFTLPNGIAPGDYSLSVIANGIASGPVPFTVAGPTRPASLAHRVSLAPFAVVATTGTAIGSPGPTRKQVDGATATEAAVRARTAETGGTSAPQAAGLVESEDTGMSSEVRGDAFFATDALADSLAVLLE